MGKKSKEQQQFEELRWELLGFGEADSNAKFDGSDGKHAVNQIDEVLRNSQYFPDSRKTATNRKPRLRLIAFVALLGFLLVAVAATKTAVAWHQRFACEDFASGLISLSLDLYSEDLKALTDYANETRKLLPETLFWKEEPLLFERAISCSDALYALIYVRSGFSEASTHQLEKTLDWAPSFVESNDSQVSNLDFIYNVIVGKACIEVPDQYAQRATGINYDPELAEKFLQAGRNFLKQALKIAESNESQFPTDDQRFLFLAALNADLARLEAKFLGKRPNELEQRRQEIENYCEQAKMLVGQVQEHGSDYWQIRSRVLSEEVFVLYKLIRQPVGKSHADLETSHIELESRIFQLEKEILDAEIQNEPSVSFGLGLCFSNISDCLFFLNWEKQAELSKVIPQLVRGREKAIGYFQSIERVRRTERCFENIVMNRGRVLRLKSMSQSDFGRQQIEYGEELRADAAVLKTMLGNLLLLGDTGQLRSMDRLLAASMLAEVYSDEELKEYANGIKSWQRNSDEYKWIMPLIEKYFD